MEGVDDDDDDDDDGDLFALLTPTNSNSLTMNFLFGSGKSNSTYENSAHNAVLPHALQSPAISKLKGKHVVLASTSPRRKDILHTCVCPSISYPGS